MLNKKNLEKYKTITGLNLGQIERDYLQHLTLMLSFRIFDEHLVFKGGTSLHKVYGLNRFSEDLDFNICKETNMMKAMKKISQNIALFGYENSIDILKNQQKVKTIRLKIKGPLFNGQEKTALYLRIEISEREKLTLEPTINEINPLYEDIPSYQVKVMNLREILAEKVRALMTRDAARDVFDINFLLKKNITPDLKLINMKLKYYKISFVFKKFEKSIEEKEQLWKKDLSKLVLNLPDFEKVKQAILSEFKKLRTQ